MKPSKPPQRIAASQDPLSGSITLPNEVRYPFLDPPAEKGDLGQLAHYRVLRLLGVGGMGFVFEAEDTHLTRRVALKVMKPEFAADLNYRERFLREARAAAGLDSDYIVTIYQVGIAGDVPFQAMQLLTGESLQDRLGRELPSVGLACRILRQVAEGLAVAHEKGLTHRDIKPANIWLESRPDGMSGADSGLTGVRAKLLDFGLARADSRDTHLTATGTIVGTPHYMSPEQASGHALDGRADLFSLGCVAHSMFTGDLAFEGQSTMAVLMALANHTPPRITEKNPHTPPMLAELVASLMAKEPQNRPQSAAEVCAKLDAIIAELPVSRSGMAPVRTEPRSGGEIPLENRSTQMIAGVPTPALPFSQARSDSATQPARVKSPPWMWVMVSIVAVAVSTLGIVLVSNGSRNRNEKLNPGAPPVASGERISVGILHSATGTMANSESPVVDATRLAIEEVNAAGGVLGRQLEPIVIDGKSDPATFKLGAEVLLGKYKVATIFGCWTSASRKAVRSVVEQNNGLLFYPVQYEGLEQSPRVVYLGPTANQQLTPSVEFLVQKQAKKRLFLVGSDYVFPRSAHEIVKDQAKGRAGFEVTGEAFIPLGSKDVTRAIAKIKAAKPDAILNTINGTTNFHFFHALNADPETAPIPVLSLSVTENDIRALDPKGIDGDFLAGTYFETIGSPSGKAFMDRFRKRYGAERRYADPLVAAYCGVHLWANAANKAQNLDPDAVVNALRGATFAGPIGELKIDPDTLHSWLPTRIGRIHADGSVEAVAGSETPIRPIPFPPSRTRNEWDRYLTDLFLGWDNQWQAPRAK